MCLKQFAATLRVKALSAPTTPPSDVRLHKAVFRHESITFRCLNSCNHITAMADRIEKNFNKNFSASKMPRPVVIRREPVQTIVNRFLKDGDTHNAAQLQTIAC